MTREVRFQTAVLTKEITEARRKETELWDAKLPHMKKLSAQTKTDRPSGL